MCEQIVALMAEGRSKRAACAELGIIEDTLYRWVKEKPEFSEAVKNAEIACQKWWEDKGREAMQGDIEGFNATAFVWMTKNVLKWRDRHDVTSDDQPISVNINLHADD